MIKGLIFDLDGCLIDSKDVQKAAFLGSYDIVVGDNNCPSYEEYIKHTGDSIDNVIKKMGLPLEMASYYRRISCESIDKIQINWELIELIDELRKDSVKISICTGKDHYRTTGILKYYKIERLFDTCICADDVKNPKPAPDPIIAALDAMQVKVGDALMIGDGYNDILSAKNAGVASVLTLWYGDEGVPQEASYVVKSILELKELIFRLR